MASYRINDAELAALLGEGADLFHLYIGAIRPRMDFKTGIVGRRPGVRISYQALREWTERAARSGVRFMAHDKSKLQRMLARLQQLGLLRKMGGPYDLVFACPLADRDNCDQKQADTKSIQPERPTKPSQGKPSRQLSTTGKNEEAATHPESGNTLNPPPPTSSGLRPEEDGSIDPPAPAAQEADNPNIDETPNDTDAQRLSEERHEQEMRGGERPPAGRSDEGANPEVSWETHLHWPTGIKDRQRAYIARRLGEVPESLRQRVLDEWHGATKTGVAKKPWPYFNGLLRNVKERGEAWTSVHADDVAEARELERLRLANQAANEAARAARLQGESVAPGDLLAWKRGLDAARERCRQS